jgi:hypothetical protein
MEKSKLTGQTKDAGFQIGVRKTFPVSVNAAWEYLFSKEGFHVWLGTINPDEFEVNKVYNTLEGIEGKVTVLNPYSHVRLTWKPKNWTNYSALQLRVINSKDRATISFHQDKLVSSNQRQDMKLYWDKVMEKIGAGLLNK